MTSAPSVNYVLMGVPVIFGAPRSGLPGRGAGDGAAGIYQHAPAVARRGVALHRLVQAPVRALRDEHCLVLVLSGLLLG